MSELYLYHATDRKNLDSILEHGLLINPPIHNWNDIYCDGQIFLAFDPNVANDFVLASESQIKDVVVLKISLSSLHEESIGYDWNNRCEYQNHIVSCVYKLNIPANVISIASTSDEGFNIDDYKNTDMYEIIMNTFDEEVETNLENE